MGEQERREAHNSKTPHPFEDFQANGLLWLVNRVVFHPRGYALAFHKTCAGTISGWSMLGDGTETWSFSDTPGQDQPTEDELFDAVNSFLASVKDGG